MKTRSKSIIIISVLAVLVVAATILLALFVPVKGTPNDWEYWSEYDEFDISQVESIETGGEEFRILQLTDLHYHLPHMTKKTDNVVKTLVEQNSPDMIVITGDSVFGSLNDLYTSHVAELMDSFRIPWAIVYGNHDSEGKADKFRMGEVYSEAEYCMYENGPYNIGGTGNYAVNLTKNGEPFYSLIMMDSNRVTQYNGNKEYGSFTPAQVSWYEWLINGLEAGGYDKSMMFFHIPFPEYLDAYEAWQNGETTGSGDKYEGVCSSTYNPGMFSKILELGNTGYTFAGHDHVNDYSVSYKGVQLTYGLKSSEQFYYREDMVGGTLITISPDSSVSIVNKFVEV